MKAILLSIKPQWLAKILNGEKTIEVRKNKALANAIKNLINQFGKAVIYLCCSKGKPYLTFEYVSVDDTLRTDYPWGYQLVKKLRDDAYVRHEQPLNGKVVARFWCDKVEEIVCYNMFNVPTYNTELLFERQLCIKSCLGVYDLFDYLGNKNGYAIHISKLEIFDKPRELSEFHTVNKYGIPQYQFGNGTCEYRTVRKAPQNYCYVEGEQP